MSSIDRDNTNEHWRSLGELADTPEFRAFLKSEFPTKAEGMSRRRWLQLMGASIALAGAGGCWQRQEILPFAERPEGRTPGKTQQYTTAMDLSGSALGLSVTCVDGRPIKVEGNPKHPMSLGATNAFAQATLLELYDPERSQSVYQKDEPSDWDAFAKALKGVLKNDGSGLRILSELSSSETIANLRRELLRKFPEAKWHEYEPLAGTTNGFRAVHSLDKADVIVSLEADLFGTHSEAVRNARAFAEGREVVDGKMNRLYAIESCFTTTGSVADHRLALSPSRIAAFAAFLMTSLTAKQSGDYCPDWLDKKFADALRSDLVSHSGRCVVIAGATLPPAAHVAVAAINDRLQNVGKTVQYVAEPEPAERIASLVEEMAGGKVETLIVLGGNPVYNAPSDLKFADALGKVETSIHLSSYRDETSRACTWHLPRAHFLEAWGDARAYDGTYSAQQPMIAPLHGGKSVIELLSLALGKSEKPIDLVRKQAGTDFRRVLHDGVCEKGGLVTVETDAIHQVEDGGQVLPSPYPMPEDFQYFPQGREFNLAREAAALRQAAEECDSGEKSTKPVKGELELVFTADPTLFDGRFANNGWLQEMPAPMTRLTWDNAALLSPATAEKLGVEDQTLVTVKVGDRELTMAAHVMPGQAPDTVGVQLGYGRTAAGSVGGDTANDVDSVGFDTYKLRTSDAMWTAAATVTPTGEKYPLANVQDHYAIDAVGLKARQGRIGKLVREATLHEFEHHPDFAQHEVHHPPLESLWEEQQFDGHHWGMTIDLSKCTGCGACVVACQAENNIPVVGKEQVIRGREMHWIRIDRYFRGDPEAPEAVHQPVACQQCELAPCEQVCPVAATVHTTEGLNDMVYNRCVGTRYCANNCPYKVRRFNFFNLHKELKKPENEVRKMVYNPEVTVRSRGVMEKCSYCVQRIQAAKIEAKNSRRPIADGEIKTACQQVCPAGAIVFGDLSDKESAVAKGTGDDRAYAMLAELNIKPRTSFLARIRNPNPKLKEHGDDTKHAHEHDEHSDHKEHDE